MTAALVGKYQVEHELGSGSQGRVFKAADPILGRNVALKSLKNASVEHKTLLKEAKTLARLSHANIVTLFELIEEDENAFLVMEYVDGEPLSSRLKAGPLPIEDAIVITCQLADAIAVAVDAGIVHGDIKPGNVMLDRKGVPRLVDFGLAKYSARPDALATLTQVKTSAETDTGPALSSLEGTLPYMAPEAIMGERLDDRADIFSLGAVFYEMVTGVRAFAGASQGAILNRVLNDRPASIQKLRPDAPRWVGELISAMLEKQPGMRPQSIKLVRDRLAMGGRSDVKAAVKDLLRRAHRLATRKRRAPQWLKAGAVAATSGIAVWAGLIVTRDVAPPVSIRMSEGLERVHHFEYKGAVKEAQDLFSSILAENRDHAGATAGLALAMFREYTSMETDPAILRRATALAERAYEDAPHLALAVIASAWAAEFNADFDKAHAHYDEAEILDPDNPLIFEGRARTFRKQGALDTAISVTKEALTSHPNADAFYTLLGALLSQQGHYAQAEQAFRNSIQNAPSKSESYAHLSHELHMQGNTEEAIKVVQQGLNIEQNARLYNNLGAYLFFQGRYEQATDAFEKTLAFEGNSHNYLYWANLADSQRWTPGGKKEAVTSYRRAIQLLQPSLLERPLHPALTSRNALYHAKLGDLETARRALNTLILHHDLKPVQMYRAAVTLEILNDRREALSMLEKAIDSGYALIEIENDPELAELRQDQAYQHILAKRSL